MHDVAVHPEVDEALRAGRPVVALETALLTHGLPRAPLAGFSDRDPGGGAGWDRAAPVNLEAARAMGRVVRAGGAVPAPIGVLKGRLHLGLDDEALAHLAADTAARKTSIAGLAHAIASGHSAGTTVSATLAACMLPKAGAIRVFATGGIGGVHRAWTRRPDISADLRQLARTPVCVVCAGGKSVLDLPATVEALEGLGVPVVGYRTDRFPRFHAAGDDRLRTPQRLDDPAAVARMCRQQWDELGQETGVLLANPIAEAFALDGEELEEAARQAERIADHRGVIGADRTPFLLEQLTRLTGGRSLLANLALLVNNAKVAAVVASALARG
ncbi:MAG: pseudouridine-5'-phosphate glycosidase [Planctomycetota bacterium]|nr:pseudouridine-5'-phosphate glycosidase [Planctomycetota bacterium]